MMAVSPRVYMGHPCGCQRGCRLSEVRFPSVILDDVGDEAGQAIQEVFRLCQRLTELTGRPFSPDGHLVGSIGEVFAQGLLNLTLMPLSNDGYDAVDATGRKVEIKTTSRSAVSLSSSGTKAERLVVIAVDVRGEPEVAYDGPSEPAWEAAGRPQKNGQRRISLSTLRTLVEG